MIYDAAIVGLGPAGSTTACELSSRGLKVIAFDRSAFPRYKACGGGLSPKVLKASPFPLDEVLESHINRVKLTLKGRDEFLVEAANPFCYTVMRSTFDHFLAEKARTAGAVLKTAEAVTGFSEHVDNVEVRTDKATYKAACLIGADGANSIIASQGCLARKKRRYFTLTAELKVPGKILEEFSTTAWIDLGTIPRGCAWIFPKQQHLTLGTGLFYAVGKKLKNPEKHLYHYLNNYPPLKNAEIKGKPRAHFIATLVDERSKLGRDRLFLVGEAGGLVEPFTGEGIYYAMRSARILSALLASGASLQETQQDYHRQLRIEFFPEFKIADRIARFAYNFPAYSHKLLHRYRHLGNYYQGVLAGETGFHDTYQRMVRRIKTLFGEKGLLARIKEPLW